MGGDTTLHKAFVSLNVGWILIGGPFATIDGPLGT